MNVFKRIYKKLNTVSMVTALVVGVGAAVAMGNVSAQSCATLGAPYDKPGNSVIGNGAPSVTLWPWQAADAKVLKSPARTCCVGTKLVVGAADERSVVP